MRVLGIDPGLTGAIAVWDGAELLVEDVPSVKARSRGNQVNIPLLVSVMKELEEENIDAAYIERVSVRPGIGRKGQGGQGIASSGKFMETSGILVGCTAMITVNIFRPTPSQWKKALGLGKDKEYARTRAIEIFPTFAHFFSRKKDHNRAEAALLAYYGLGELRKRRGRKRLSDFR